MKNTFKIVAPMYNASDTLARMLHSLYGQSYEDWHLYLIDDVSTPQHVEKSKVILRQFENINPSKITVTWNTEKKWEVANVLHGISQCDDNDIVCRVDADDWLTEIDALACLDSIYKQTGAGTLDCASMGFHR